MRWQKWEASISVSGYTRQLALVYPDTLMLGFHFLATPIQHPPPIFVKNKKKSEEKKKKDK